MLVLDTHVLVWWVNADTSKLSPVALDAIEREMQGGEIIVSSISAWEIGMLAEKGRMTLTMDVSQWLTLVAQIQAVRFYPVDNEIALESVQLPGDFHKDPADRMIVATARKLGATLITADEKILAYQHVKTVW